MAPSLINKMKWVRWENIVNELTRERSVVRTKFIKPKLFSRSQTMFLGGWASLANMQSGLNTNWVFYEFKTCLNIHFFICVSDEFQMSLVSTLNCMEPQPLSFHTTLGMKSSQLKPITSHFYHFRSISVDKIGYEFHMSLKRVSEKFVPKKHNLNTSETQFSKI